MHLPIRGPPPLPRRRCNHLKIEDLRGYTAEPAFALRRRTSSVSRRLLWRRRSARFCGARLLGTLRELRPRGSFLGRSARLRTVRDDVVIPVLGRPRPVHRGNVHGAPLGVAPAPRDAAGRANQEHAHQEAGGSHTGHVTTSTKICDTPSGPYFTYVSQWACCSSRPQTTARYAF
jgi:hypothetical protein